MCWECMGGGECMGWDGGERMGLGECMCGV